MAARNYRSEHAQIPDARIKPHFRSLPCRLIRSGTARAWQLLGLIVSDTLGLTVLELSDHRRGLTAPRSSHDALSAEEPVTIMIGPDCWRPSLLCTGKEPIGGAGPRSGKREEHELSTRRPWPAIRLAAFRSCGRPGDPADLCRGSIGGGPFICHLTIHSVRGAILGLNNGASTGFRSLDALIDAAFWTSLRREEVTSRAFPWRSLRRSKWTMPLRSPRRFH